MKKIFKCFLLITIAQFFFFNCKKDGLIGQDIGSTLVLPQIEIPDSLGGTKLKGEAVIRITINKSNKITSTAIAWLRESFDLSHEIYYNGAGKYSTEEEKIKGDSLFRKMNPWLKLYFPQIKLKRKIDKKEFGNVDTLYYLYVVNFNTTSQHYDGPKGRF